MLCNYKFDKNDIQMCDLWRSHGRNFAHWTRLYFSLCLWVVLLQTNKQMDADKNLLDEDNNRLRRQGRTYINLLRPTGQFIFLNWLFSHFTVYTEHRNRVVKSGRRPSLNQSKKKTEEEKDERTQKDWLDRPVTSFCYWC